MSSIDLASLLSDVSEAEPAGPNLEDELQFAELVTTAKGKPEQQFDETVIPGEEPDWRRVKSLALDLIGRSRDLRVGATLTRALMRTDGFEGLADGLALIHGWADEMWDSVHPQLDPSDPDPIRRANALSGLDGFDSMIRAVREMPIVASRAVGRYSYKDVLVATNKLPAPAGQSDSPSLAAIGAAFQDAPIEDVQRTAGDLGRALEAIAGIEKAFTSRVGAARGVTFDQLSGTLKGAAQVVADQLANKSAAAGDAGVESADGAPSGPRAATGEIRTRDDVVKLLDKMCEYFERIEPSSPVPILLRRAKRLINKSFLDLVRDMASNGVSQVELFRGPEE